MAAGSVSITTTPNPRRRPLTLTSRRLAANRRNAARSTGPRTAVGKARVARNALKHGFFAGPERWTPTQRRDFNEMFVGFSEDFRPAGSREEMCVATMAESYVRMAAMLRYENLAALKHHREQERELEVRIAVADAAEAARLRAGREDLQAAGLWCPTIPGPREAAAICRYSGRLDRTIRRAVEELQGLKSLRLGVPSRPGSQTPKVQKQTHFPPSPGSGPEEAEGPQPRRSPDSKVQKQTHFPASPGCGPEVAEGPRMASFSLCENAETNPLSSMFTGNRHARRRAKALARQRKET